MRQSPKYIRTDVSGKKIVNPVKKNRINISGTICLIAAKNPTKTFSIEDFLVELNKDGVVPRRSAVKSAVQYWSGTNPIFAEHLRKDLLIRTVGEDGVFVYQYNDKAKHTCAPALAHTHIMRIKTVRYVGARTFTVKKKG